MRRSNKESLSGMWIERGELDHIMDVLEKIKNAIEMNDREASEKKVLELMEFVGMRLTNMENYVHRFPIEKIKGMVDMCINEKRVPFINDAGLHTSEYKDMVDQGVNATLRDLRRNLQGLYLTYNDRTINDLGCAVLITHLMNENKELKKKTTKK